MAGLASFDLLFDEANMPFTAFNDPLGHDRQDDGSNVNKTLQRPNVVNINNSVENHGHPRMVVIILQAVKGFVKREMANDIESHILQSDGHSWVS